MPTASDPLQIGALSSGARITLSDIAEIGPLDAFSGGASLAGRSLALFDAPPAIDPARSLLIRDLSVIQAAPNAVDPCAAPVAGELGKWTFGYLMEQMAQGSGHTPSEFARAWLGSWLAPQTILGDGGVLLDAVSPRAGPNMTELVIDRWLARSGSVELDMRLAPFRLQAIVYRPDLGGTKNYGASTRNAGELRFVFGLLEVADANGDGDAQDMGDLCQSREFAVIFEYGVPLTDCDAIKAWAQSFAALSGMTQDSPLYRDTLLGLTEQVVRHGAAPTKPPNQNALNQLRTNELNLTLSWQMREFVLDSATGLLAQTTTKNNPRDHQFGTLFSAIAGQTPEPFNLNQQTPILSEITSRLLPILSDIYRMPQLSGGAPFLGGVSTYRLGTFWDHPQLKPGVPGVTRAHLEARFRFSALTCDGCHTRETATDFYHMRPRPPGSSPTLSSFLLKDPFPVPDPNGNTHIFMEATNRKNALSRFANMSCSLSDGTLFNLAGQDGLNSTH